MEVSGQLHAPTALSRETGRAPEPVWAFRKREKSLVATGIRTPDRPAISLVAITTIPANPRNKDAREMTAQQHAFFTSRHDTDDSLALRPSGNSRWTGVRVAQSRLAWTRWGDREFVFPGIEPRAQPEPSHASNCTSLAPRDWNNIWLTFKADSGSPTYTIFRLKVLWCSLRTANIHTSATVANATCSHIVKDVGNKLHSKAPSTAFLSKFSTHLAQGVSTITFYCGKAINRHVFTFVTTYLRTWMSRNALLKLPTFGKVSKGITSQ